MESVSTAVGCPSGDLTTRRTHKIQCKDHAKNCVEFHCTSCQTAACKKCRVLHHDNCKNVVTIESMNLEMKAKLKEKRKAIIEELRQKSKETRRVNADIKAASLKKQKLLSQIQFVSQEAVDRIRMKEEQLIDQLEESSETQMEQLQSLLVNTETRVQACKEILRDIDKVLDTENVMGMYEASHQRGIEVEVKGIEETDHGRIEDITFSHDLDKLKRALVSVHLGEIRVKTNKREENELEVPVLCSSFDPRTKDDNKKPNLLDVTVLSVGGKQVVVAVDLDNCCLKSFYTKHKKFHVGKLPLENYPFGMTKMSENQIKVTLPVLQLILTIDLTPNFEQRSNMKTNKKYYSLAFIAPSTLLAGCCYPIPSVDILNMAGEVLNSVEIFNKPIYMGLTNTSNVLVSDWKRRCVTCLTREGDVLWRYMPTGSEALRCVYGVTCGPNGQILLADRDLCKVTLLNERREVIRDILTDRDGIREVQGISLDEKLGCLYVCDRTIVKVFKIDTLQKNYESKKRIL